MDLMNYVNTQVRDENEMFSIGCSKGSGWIFIGTKKEFHVLINRISDDYKNYYEECFKNAERRLTYTKIPKGRRLEVRDKNTLKLRPETDEEYRERLHKSVDELHDTINHKFDLYLKHRERIDSFLNFQDRWVEDTHFTAISNMRCIMITGDDLGNFWLRSEFEKGYLKKLGSKIKFKVTNYNDDEEDYETTTEENTTGEGDISEVAEDQEG